jgi:hypothetical protein
MAGEDLDIFAVRIAGAGGKDAFAAAASGRIERGNA